MNDTLVDLRHDLDTPEFRALLLLLVGWRNEPVLDRERLDRVIGDYRTTPGLRVLGFKRAGVPVAIIAVDIAAGNVATIRHIVVQPELRRHGLGGALILETRVHLGLSEIRAETDRDAVGFYERSGFRVTSLGEKYRGVERFFCAWV